MFDPNASLPRVNRNMVYLGACLIAVVRTGHEESPVCWVSIEPTSRESLIQGDPSSL